MSKHMEYPFVKARVYPLQNAWGSDEDITSRCSNESEQNEGASEKVEDHKPEKHVAEKDDYVESEKENKDQFRQELTSNTPNEDANLPKEKSSGTDASKTSKRQLNSDIENDESAYANVDHGSKAEQPLHSSGNSLVNNDDAESNVQVGEDTVQDTDVNNDVKAYTTSVHAQNRNEKSTTSSTEDLEKAKDEPNKNRTLILFLLPVFLILVCIFLVLGILLALYIDINLTSENVRMLVDMTDDCTSDYCFLNGGSCHDDFLGKTCYCQNEYTGERCEDLIKDCECDSSYECIGLGNTSYCSCSGEYGDITILLDVSGSMNGHRDAISSMFDYFFSNLPVGPEENRFAFQEIYGSNGWDLASPDSYTLTSGSDIFLNASYDYDSDWSFYDDDLMESVQRDLIDPGDRDYACNIIIVIWDGDAALNLSFVAAGTRFVSIGANAEEDNDYDEYDNQLSIVNKVGDAFLLLEETSGQDIVHAINAILA